MIFNSLVFAGIPKERRLKKLSMHIKGVNPTMNEYKKVGKLEDEFIEQYFIDKTAEYLKSQNHIEKMNIRLNQLFRLGLPSYILENGYNRSEQNSLNFLFKDIVKNNLSWDTLLNGKKYKMSQSSENFIFSDFGFYGAVIPQESLPRRSRGVLNASNLILQPEIVDGEYKNETEFLKHFDFGLGDERIAGAITTERFFGRYVNTSVNKNRKRAAAVFRIFLCDDMEAAITDSADRTEYILNFVFPDTTGMSSSDVSSITIGDSAHGSRPDCMACHYKLDPLGQNFGGSATSLAPTAFSGALTYRASSGDKVSIRTKGLGSLGEEIIRQEDYRSCQTKQFWTWFIGEDEYLQPQVHAELNSEFERVDGRVNDFISYLVNRKEFYTHSSLSEEAELAFKVKRTLKSCNQCHDNEGIPSFTDWPIENDSGKMKYWSSKIYKSLGGDNRERTMPPKSHIWQPTREEIAEIINWINIGAPNEQGQIQIP